MTASDQESKEDTFIANSLRHLRNIPYRVVVLVALVLAAVSLERMGVTDWRHMVRTGEIHAHTWWFPFALVVLKISFYTFAFPGSVFFWVAGLLYQPWEATLMIVAGGVGGAICAYFFSRKLSHGFSQKVRDSRFFRVMENQSDFATLCAVRTLPSFPHSIINYSAGMLHIPLARFALSTLIGFTAKGYVYASAIRLAATADEISDTLSLKALLPLLALGVLFISGKLFQRRFSKDPE
jgi:uncharacterized membrane protein YdjX (TVP38/TMEM64 family)